MSGSIGIPSARVHSIQTYHRVKGRKLRVRYGDVAVRDLRQGVPSAPHIRPICAADRHICAASMCDLRRFHVRSAWRSRRSSRAAAAGARCRAAARLWRAAAAVGSAPADAAREPGHPQMVAGQAAGKLPYATTWWLLDAVARHATAASSDFFCVPFGGRANGRVCQQYLQRPQRPREPCTVRLRRRLLRALPLPAARAAAARRTLAGCVCAAGCRTPSRASVRRGDS